MFEVNHVNGTTIEFFEENFSAHFDATLILFYFTIVFCEI